MLFNVVSYSESKDTHYIRDIKDNTLLFLDFNLILQFKILKILSL